MLFVERMVYFIYKMGIKLYSISNYHNGWKMKKRKNVKFDEKEIITDPNGSWTGVPLDKNEKPIQDADDL